MHPTGAFNYMVFTVYRAEIIFYRILFGDCIKVVCPFGNIATHVKKLVVVSFECAYRGRAAVIVVVGENNSTDYIGGRAVGVIFKSFRWW